MNFSIAGAIRKKFFKLKGPYSLSSRHNDYSTVVARLVNHGEFELVAQHHDANDDGAISLFKWRGHRTWILVDRFYPSTCELTIKSREAHENVTLAMCIIEGLRLSSSVTVDDLTPRFYDDEPF
jgi:hypothetical protein